MNLPRNAPLNCRTIPAGFPFVNVLARWVVAQYGQEPAELTRILVLLPNRRACRSLREAFLDCMGGKPLLLPRIQPVGDVEDEPGLYCQEAYLQVPPAIPPMRRQLLLTRLVMDFKKRQTETGGAQGYFDVEQAAELARHLGQFIDDVAREGLSFDRLSALVPQELAEHWQQTLEFLGIVLKQWPAILAESEVIDPVDHRNRQLLATASAWRRRPPAFPVIAAGSTGSIPATAELLSVIARLPQGMVILPGLDTDMPESEWKLLEETHPQFGLRQLLSRMECPRGSVTPLEDTDTRTPVYAQRGVCLRAFFQAPEATSGWARATLPLEEGLKGVSLLAAETLLDEARMIAIVLREVLETPGKTAALVTPDRTLARMVAAQMRRFNVEIDDSAGHILSDTPAGCFLRLAVEVATTGVSPVPLLSLLRHPLAAVGRDPAQCRQLSRALEKEVLRGLRRAPGLNPLIAAAKNNEEVKNLLADLDDALKPLMECLSVRQAPLATLLSAHIACAERLAATHDEGGAGLLWAGEAGNRIAAFIADCLHHADVLVEVDTASYGGLFETLLSGQSYYPRFGMHPRLHIVSPIEARLQRFDKVILGGLNEGSWPAPSAIDPWMSRPMRAAFGLPAAERDIGQSAHDVYMLCASPEVLLTRARKVNGAPTVPSRWLVRMETLAGGIDKARCDAMRSDAYYEQAKALLDAPMNMAALARPEPKPPFAARPRRMRVTAIDTWLRDPYAIYARHILNLRKLEALDEEPDAADFGSLVHKALEHFTRKWPQALPADALEELLVCGREAFSDMLERPAVACLWWPRFEVMAGWFIEQEMHRRGTLARVLTELDGKWTFDVDGNPFTLTTRIDRLEIGRDGSTVIADYKTGSVPSGADIKKGKSNQLFLEALIATHGTLQPPLATKPAVTELAYWKLSGNRRKCEITTVGIEGVSEAQSRLTGLIAEFDHADTPYAAQRNPARQAEQYNDYQHLMRRQEWEDA